MNPSARSANDLGRRELVSQTRQRPQQSVQRRERQRRLDLEPSSAQHHGSRASAISRSSSADLPTPGSPRTTTLPAVPWRA